ncbi:7655_t:CDS:2, partial [Scutellospora calospora]
ACSQVLLVCLAGYLAARLELITTSIQKDLSSLIINIFMPCFLFSNVFSSVDIQTLISLWPIPTFFFIFCIISSALGFFGGRLLNFDFSDTKFIMTGIIFNNVTSLGLGLLRGIEYTDAISILKWKIDDTPKDIVSRGISYVLLATLWTNLLRWSLGAYLLKSDSVSSQYNLNSVSYISQHNFDEIDDINDVDESTPMLGSKQHDTTSSLTFKQKLHSIWSRIKISLTFKFMNPPLYAALLALVFVAIPPFKSLFIGKNAPFMALSQAIEYVGSVSVPLTLITLGAQLKNLQSSNNKRIASMITYALTCRLIIMPIIGTVMVLLTKSWYLNDPMLWF